MKLYQDEQVVFRCTSQFKEKIKNYADANRLTLSEVIRISCSAVIKKEVDNCLEIEEILNSRIS